MFREDRSSATFAHGNRIRALTEWRDAERLVSTRWEVFREAEREAQDWAFASYLAAPDAEEAAAGQVAAFLTRTAA